MAFAGKDVEVIARHVINETVGVIDAAAPSGAMLEGLRLADSLRRAVALYVLDEIVDFFSVFLSWICQ